MRAVVLFAYSTLILLSEPVTQNTKRFTRCFWALDKSLAYARHYPAINWNTSYSEYVNDLSAWYYDNAGPEFMNYRDELCSILLEENSLMEIVKLIGADVLPDSQRLVIEISNKKGSNLLTCQLVN